VRSAAKWLAGVTLAAWAVAQAAAQPPGGMFGGPGDMFGGPGGMMGGPGGMMGGPGGMMGGPGGMMGPQGGASWGGRRSMRRGGPDGDPGRSSQLVSLLRQFDANGDGTITSGEVSLSRRSAYEGVVRRAGLDPSGPVSVQALADALSQRGGRGSRDGGPSTSNSDTSQSGTADSAAAQPTLVPGFGAAATQTAMVPGFGASVTVASVSSPTPASSSASSSSPSAPPSSNASSPPSPAAPSAPPQLDSRMRRYAESLLRQYDKNKNGVLEKDEWSQMRGTWHDADANGDGTITLDELGAKLGRYSGRGSSSSSSSSPSSPVRSPPSGASSEGGGATSSAGTDPSARKSYRFLSPQERLPQGLPDWFVRKDANGDGQVSMAEYSQTWSNSLAEEFAKYDRNGDGVVTPEEAIKAQGSK